MEEVTTSQVTSLKISLKEDFCHVHLRGNFSIDKIPVFFWEEVRKFCDSKSLNAILVEEDLNERVNIAPLYDYIHLVSSYLKGFKIAYLDRRLDHQSINKFGEDVACNTGMILKTFTALDAARDYLTQSIHSSSQLIDRN